MSQASPQSPAPAARYRHVKFWDPAIEIRREADGVIYVEAKTPLPPFPDRATEPLLHWAGEKPDTTLFAERGPTANGTGSASRRPWRTRADSGSSCWTVGFRPRGRWWCFRATISLTPSSHWPQSMSASPTPPSRRPMLWSRRISRGCESVFETLTPGMVFTADAAPFAKALDEVAGADILRLHRRGAKSPEEDFATALKTEPTPAVDAAHAAITPDTIAKFLFTSGSTGMPKAVANTHRMICSNQIMARECFAFFKDEPPMLLDWAPWHHTAGGNKLFFLPVFNGGTLHIDDGNPTPAGIEKTVSNLREVSPNWYFNVPKGFEALIPFLKQDAGLRESLFRNLKMLWYAGAGMAQHVWDDLTSLAEQTVGERIVIGTGLGATETAPAALFCTWPQDQAGNVGLPCPGVSLKLVPMDGKLDARVKGPNITPGYWRAPDLTAKAFDEEGYYCFGDALRPADPSDLSAGFLFDGRTAENFKLDTGTWVSTGALRTSFIDHFGGLVRDVALAGADRPYLSAIVFPDVEALRTIAGLGKDAAVGEIYADEKVRSAMQEKLSALAKTATGSSNRVRKMILAEEPPDFASGEQTDKGSINQRMVLSRRQDLVEELYSDSPRLQAASDRRGRPGGAACGRSPGRGQGDRYLPHGRVHVVRCRSRGPVPGDPRPRRRGHRGRRRSRRHQCQKG
jgi:feruloyl-CoA synthase